MKAKVNWTVKSGTQLLFLEGDIVDLDPEQFTQANRDSPGCLTAIESEVAAPEDRMLRGGYSTRAPKPVDNAMHRGNMPGMLPDIQEPAVTVVESASVEAVEPVEETKPEVPVTDAALALAEEHGLDLDLIEGTGKDGKITIGDVRAALE